MLTLPCTATHVPAPDARPAVHTVAGRPTFRPVFVAERTVAAPAPAAVVTHPALPVQVAPVRPAYVPQHAAPAAARPKPHKAAPKHAAAAQPVVAVVSGSRGTVVAFLYAQLGKPYRFATSGPNTYDCSGLVMAAYATVGVRLAHKASSFYGVGHAVSWGAMQPGDIIVLEGGGHAAVYVGAGMMIEAPHAGADVRLVPARVGTVRSLF